MSKHTKGQWVIEHFGGRIYVTAESGGMSADLGLSSPTTEDYARLIAAAPEMLDILRGFDVSDFYTEEAYERVRAVIRKAEGHEK